MHAETARIAAAAAGLYACKLTIQVSATCVGYAGSACTACVAATGLLCSFPANPDA